MTPTPTTPPADDLHAMSERVQRVANLLNRMVADDAMADATSGVTFVSDHARQQALGLLRQEIRVDGDKAIGADGRPAATVIRERLADPAFSHFLQAQHRGGTAMSGYSGAVSPIQHPAAPIGEPRNLGEAAVAQAQARRAAAANAGPGNPLSDIRLPFGLKPQR